MWSTLFSFYFTFYYYITAFIDALPKETNIRTKDGLSLLTEEGRPNMHPGRKDILSYFSRGTEATRLAMHSESPMPHSNSPLVLLTCSPHSLTLHTRVFIHSASCHPHCLSFPLNLPVESLSILQATVHLHLSNTSSWCFQTLHG